jgi:beta-lactamase regulating signal transducer with metallopeptidase domain
MTNLLVPAVVAISSSAELSLLAKSAIVLAAGLTVARLLRRRRASVRHLVLAATLCAVLVLPLAAILMPAAAIPVAGRSTSGAVGVTAGAAAIAVPTGTDLESAAGAAGHAQESPAAAWTTMLRALWATGTAGVLLWLAMGLRRLERTRRSSLPCLELHALADSLAGQAGFNRRIDVVTHELVLVPVACGGRRPTIMLPTDVRRWSDSDVRRALVHEIEHVRRADWLVQLAGRIACAIYWFNPLAWIALRQLCLDAERACDDAVVLTSEGIEYAEQLVALARRFESSPAPLTPGMANRSDLSVRVAALLDARQRRGRAGFRCVGGALSAASIAVLGLAPLHAVPASRDASAESTRAALVQGDDRQRLNRSDRALVRAAARGDVAGIARLLDDGANVNAVLHGDGSPLIVAARAGRLEAVRLLLDRGADPNLAVSGDGNPLIMAAGKGHLEVVTLLLDRGAAIDLVVPSDENALIQASGEGHLPVVRLLVARGADVNVRVWSEAAHLPGGGEWRTPLGMARRGRHQTVVDYLLSAGARE